MVVPTGTSTEQLQRHLGLLDRDAAPLVFTHALPAQAGPGRPAFTRQLEALVATLPGGHTWDSGHPRPRLEDAELMPFDAFTADVQQWVERWNCEAPAGQPSRQAVWMRADAARAADSSGTQDGEMDGGRSRIRARSRVIDSADGAC